jgi:hypothetical protein
VSLCVFRATSAHPLRHTELVADEYMRSALHSVLGGTRKYGCSCMASYLGVNSDRYFLELYLQFAHRPPPTGAPILAILRPFKTMLVVLVQESFRLEGQEHPSSSQSWRERLQMNTSSALSPDDSPQYACLTPFVPWSNSSYFLCDGKDHRHSSTLTYAYQR